MNSKIFIFILTILTVLSSSFSAQIINSNGQFSLEINKQKESVFNDDIEATFSFKVTNNLEDMQQLTFKVDPQSGWNIDVSEKSFFLSEDEQREVTLSLSANSNFDYSPSVVSPDIVKIGKREDYKGYFIFPLTIIGENENITATFEIDIEKKEIKKEFISRFSTQKISPEKPLRYSISANGLEKQESVLITVELDNEVIETQQSYFDPENNFLIFESEIPSSVNPGVYTGKLTIRLFEEADSSAREWYSSMPIAVEEYVEIKESHRKGSTFFSKTHYLELENLGNNDAIYRDEISLSSFSRMFFSIEKENGEDIEYSYQNGVASYEVEVKKGEKVNLDYEFNYLVLYVVVFVCIIILIYLYREKNANPLIIETRVYDVKRVRHEGVKSMKIKIAFENIKEEEIQALKVIFRMPGYLNIKEDSFLLAPPNHVLKGSNQYKLSWDFKRFEKQDSRVLGFTLINKRGILGDVHLPDLEFEVKVEGKVRIYKSPFQVIRG